MRVVVTTPDSGGWMLDQGLPQPRRRWCGADDPDGKQEQQQSTMGKCFVLSENLEHS